MLNPPTTLGTAPALEKASLKIETELFPAVRFFIWKLECVLNILLMTVGPPLPHKHTVPERLSHPFPNLVNWEKTGSTIYVYIQNTQFSIFFVNWEIEKSS